MLKDKPEVIILTKSDAKTPQELADTLAHIRKSKPDTYAVSVLDDASVEALRQTLISHLR